MPGTTQMEWSLAKKDLEILVDPKLNMSEQCALTAKVVQQHRCLRKIITSQSGKGISCCEMHLGFYIRFWAPLYETEMGILE